MKDKRFIVSSSPHIRDSTNNAEIMWSVVVALVPAIISAVYFFGLQALVIILTSVLGAVVTEYLFQKARGKKVTISDGSAVVTGILACPNTSSCVTALDGINRKCCGYRPG